MTSETTVSKDELQTQLAAAWGAISTATDAMDSAKLDAAMRARKAIEKQIADFDAIAEAGARKTALDTAEAALAGMNLRDIGRDLELTGTFKRTDTGWDDLTISVRVPETTNTQFHELFPLDAFENLTSVKGVKFTINKSGATVEATGRKPGSGGGGGGSGKGYVKDGVTFKLKEAFDSVATPDEAAADAALVGDAQQGNKQFILRKKVVVAAGYTAN